MLRLESKQKNMNCWLLCRRVPVRQTLFAIHSCVSHPEFQFVITLHELSGASAVRVGLDALMRGFASVSYPAVSDSLISPCKPPTFDVRAELDINLLPSGSPSPLHLPLSSADKRVIYIGTGGLKWHEKEPVNLARIIS